MSRYWLARLAAICAILILVVTATAYAHLALESSEPASGAQLNVAPRELRLTFTEEVEVAVARIWFRDAAGTPVALSPLRTPDDSAQVIVATISAPLTAGTHSVQWQVAGTDGHPVRGTFSFTIAPGAAGLGVVVEPVPAGGEPAARITAPGQAPLPGEHHDPASMPGGPGFDAESPAYVAVRWLQYTGLLIVIGAMAFHLLVLRLMRRTDPEASLVPVMRSRAATIGFWAAIIFAVSVALRLYAQSFAMHGGAEALSGELIGTMLMRTVWGWGWMLQAVAVVIVIAGFHIARRARAGGWGIAMVGVLALSVTPALSGHAASAPRLTSLAILADTVHVIGAGGWLGSLLIVLAAGIPVALRSSNEHRGASVANLVNAYSPTALVFAGGMVVSGLFAAWLHIGLSSALWESGYGRTLLLKLGIFSVVAATGVYNWRRVRPALGDELGTPRIRRSATVELVVGAIVLIVTAVLVATPPAGDAPAGMAAAERTIPPATEQASPGTSPQ
jgi:putative copper export protein/methionine-rich copper-binding protein CopC